VPNNPSPAKLHRLLLRAASELFPVGVSAAFVGLFFSHLASEGYAWLPVLAVTLTIPAVFWSQRSFMNAAERTVLTRWERIDAPWISNLARDHGVEVQDIVSLPATGAFWIHAGFSASGTPRGVIGLGENLDDAHLETTLVHEFGHGALHHLPKRTKAAAQAVLPAFIPALLSPFNPAVVAAIAVLASFTGVLWFSAFCRRQELEADLFAFRHTDGRATLGMLDSLAPFSNPADLLALHPPISSRRSAILHAVHRTGTYSSVQTCN
jgi:Zn-dependent protease with chaperone function